MSEIIFKPLVSLPIMIIFSVVMLLIVLFNKQHIINRFLIIIVVFIISQRPMLRDKEQAVFNLDIDVVFIVDNTVSMNAVDVNGGTRLDAVKNDCKNIMNTFAGANFAVITYGNIAQVKYPFTNEYGTIVDVIDNMKIIDPNYATGSSLDLPHDYLKMLLESSENKEKHKRVVFFIGDGELTSNESSNTNFNVYNDLNGMIDSGAVLGYGTSEGGKVIVKESLFINRIVDSNGYLIDAKTGGPIISKFNEDNLKKIANSLKLNYYHMTNYSVIADKINEIKDKANEQEEDDNDEKFDMDIYYYFSGTLLVLLLVELYYCRRNEQ